MSAYSDFIKLMRKQGAVNNPLPILLAEVIQEPPELVINIGQLQISKENILVADHLLASYSRQYSESGQIIFQDSNCGQTHPSTVPSHTAHTHTLAGAETSAVTLSHAEHSHQIQSINISTDYTASGSMSFTSTFSKGDILAVMATADKQTYIVLCKVVSLV